MSLTAIKKSGLLVCGILFIALFAMAAAAQSPKPKASPAAKPTVSPLAHVRSSPAFAELLLRKTAIQAELESLLPDYTEDYPKIKRLRFELGRLQIEFTRLERVAPADSARLTLALGRLMLRKVELETELWELLNTYKEDHPDAKRAKRKVEIFEAAIADILR